MGRSGEAPNTGFADASGKTIPLTELLAQAETPVVLAFFKTSCPTCKLTWPYLQKLHELHGGKSVRVIGISQDDPAASRQFYAEHGKASFGLLFDPKPAYMASNAFEVESVPHIVLVETGGTMSHTTEGWSRDAIEALASALAERNGLPRIPVIPEGDPVAAWKPG